MEFTAVNWLIIVISALCIGVSKTGIPGIGILIVPLMASVMPAKASTGVILPMLVFADIFAVAFYRKHAVWSHLIRLMPWAVVGILIGWRCMGMVTDAQLKPIMGAIVLIMLALHYIRQHFARDEDKIPTQWWFAAMLGLAAGITTMMANAAGPIMVIYLLAMRLPKNEFIGTGAWYFLILNCFKVPFSINLGLINTASLNLNLMMFPVVAIGAVLGIFVLKKIPQKAFTAVVQILAALAAINMILPCIG